MSQGDQETLNSIANQMARQTPDEAKHNLRSKYLATFDQATQERLTNNGQDPLLIYFRTQALNKMKSDRQNAQQQQQGLSAGMTRPAPQAVPMQQQRSNNPGVSGQPQMSQNPDFNTFLGGVENLIGQQQQQGVLAEQAGHQVVPMSNQGTNIASNGISGPASNGQRHRPNAMSAQQQQQIFMQQQQQQALQANTQAQAQMRANPGQPPQAGLQGQPGGMGPKPPQQSPAMNTLNTPIRTPQQPGQVQTPQMPTPQMTTPQMTPFGQPVDPRFAQLNQQIPGAGMIPNATAADNAVLAGMSEEQRRKIMETVPPERMSVVLNEMQKRQVAGMKPPMGMPQNMPGARPGVPFNQATIGNQFAVNGQRMTPGMPQALNPQQQMLIQQQMARQPMQQGPNPQAQAQMQAQMQLAQAQAGAVRTQPTPQELANIHKIDGVAVPAQIMQLPILRVGIPPQVRTWGLLKQWIAQNQNVVPNAPQVLEQLKRFQAQHLRTVMASRAAQQAGGVQNGQTVMQAQATQPQTMTQGVPAPQPSMLQNQIGPGQGQAQMAAMMASVSAEEISKLRAHPSGRFVASNDNELRLFLVRSQMQQSQRMRAAQAQGAALQNGSGMPMQLQVPENPMQQMGQQQLIAGVQRTPGPQPPQIQQINQQQQMLQQQRQQAQAQASAQQQGQQPQPQVNKQAKPQPKSTAGKATAASPSQGQKNLKRASSDDVVEVPNPNSQNNKQQSSQQKSARPNLTPAEVAAMTPEEKQQYHARFQAAQQGQKSGQQGPDQERFAKIMEEELRRPVNYPELQLSQQEVRSIQEDIKKMLPNYIKAKSVLSRWYGITRSDEGVRRYWSALKHIQQQFGDPQKFANIKPRLSINSKQVAEAYQFAQSMVQDVASKFPHLLQGQKPMQSDANSQQPQQQTSTPLNAANLQQQQQALGKQPHKGHNRSASRNSQAPAAPTSAHPPPFPVPDQIAPHYFNKTELTQDSLKLPTAKRQRQSATSTPQLGHQTPASTSSPQVVKAGSPDQKKNALATQPQAKQQNKLMCPEPDCDHHFADGFNQAEDLEKHRTEEHNNALRDPPQYLLNELGQMLDLEADGSTKKTETQSSVVETGKTSSDTLGADLWGNVAINPLDLMHNFQGFETGAAGAISDMNVYRSITPNDTPESSKSNNSDPNSDISEGVNLNINIQGLIDDSWKPFGNGMGEFDDMIHINMDNNDDLNNMFNNDYPPYNNDFNNLDELLGPKMVEQPFSFDAGMFSVNDVGPVGANDLDLFNIEPSGGSS